MACSKSRAQHGTEFHADLVGNHSGDDDDENGDDNIDKDDNVDEDDEADKIMVAHMGQGLGTVHDTEAKEALGA